jgi:hypothetical protein
MNKGLAGLLLLTVALVSFGCSSSTSTDTTTTTTASTTTTTSTTSTTATTHPLLSTAKAMAVVADGASYMGEVMVAIGGATAPTGASAAAIRAQQTGGPV